MASRSRKARSSAMRREMVTGVWSDAGQRLAPGPATGCAQASDVGIVGAAGIVSRRAVGLEPSPQVQPTRPWRRPRCPPPRGSSCRSRLGPGPCGSGAWAGWHRSRPGGRRRCSRRQSACRPPAARRRCRVSALPQVVPLEPPWKPDRGWSSGKAPLPIMVVTTGAPRNSANCRSSSQAPAAMTPPPATMTGRSASSQQRSCGRAIRPGSGSTWPSGAVGGRVGQPVTDLNVVALDVHGQVDDDGTAPAGEHLGKGALHDARQPLGAAGPPDAFGDRLEYGQAVGVVTGARSPAARPARPCGCGCCRSGPAPGCCPRSRRPRR